MDDTDIFFKTAAGLAEVEDRALKLPQRLRTMLIMVDGTRSVAQLREAARTLNAPEDFLSHLLDQGLVRPDQRSVPRSSPAAAIQAAPPAVPDVVLPPAEAPLSESSRMRAAVKFMNDSAVDLLGLKAFFFTLRLEKCMTRVDLLELLPEFTKAIAKKNGPEMARALEERARKLLG